MPGKILVVSILNQNRQNIINKTATEIEDEDWTFIDLFQSLKGQVKYTDLLKDVNTDSITNVCIRESVSTSSETIDVTPHMNTYETCESLKCNFVQFQVSLTELPKLPACDPQKRNAFAIMFASQNECQLPQKPTGDKLSGPQRLLSDLIDWISNFDKGWTQQLCYFFVCEQELTLLEFHFSHQLSFFI